MKNVFHLYDFRPETQSQVRRYVICGLSQRALNQYARHIIPASKEFPDYGSMAAHGQLVGILDADLERVNTYTKAIGLDLPTYSPEQFDKMIEETAPDKVIVTTPDHLHVDYIVKGLEAGCDVISEKPMVIDSEQSRRVLAAEKQSGKEVRVGFNYRYTQAHIRIREMILEGRLGDITNVELAWNIDTLHGSSYFYRWNRYRDKSGGLSIHKCCHHFDLVNWWVGDHPEMVFAFGKLNYFGSNSPFKPGNASTVAEQLEQCPYFNRWQGNGVEAPEDDHLNPRQRTARLPYHGQYGQGDPKYIYDDDIAIEDTYSAVVRYKKGASLSYSCNFSAPWEGYRLAINGTGGRLELDHYSAPARCPWPASKREQIIYYPLFGEREVHDVRHVEGGHGGADPLLKQDLFREPGEHSRRIGLAATAVDGAMSVAIGEAVWKSARDQRPYRIDELLGG